MKGKGCLISRYVTKNVAFVLFERHAVIWRENIRHSHLVHAGSYDRMLLSQAPYWSYTFLGKFTRPDVNAHYFYLSPQFFRRGEPLYKPRGRISNPGLIWRRKLQIVVSISFLLSVLSTAYDCDLLILHGLTQGFGWRLCKKTTPKILRHDVHSFDGCHQSISKQDACLALLGC